MCTTAAEVGFGLDRPDARGARSDGMTSTFLGDVSAEVEIAADSTISKTVHADDGLKAVLFGFDAGQELSEHTAAVPAVLHFLAGEATVTLGDDVHPVGPGAWMHLPPRLPHSITAKTPAKMLLLLLRRAKPSS